MNETSAKNCIIGSMIAVLCVGVGFGRLSHTVALYDMLIVVSGLLLMCALIEVTTRAGYRLRMVTKDDER